MTSETLLVPDPKLPAIDSDFPSPGVASWHYKNLRETQRVWARPAAAVASTSKRKQIFGIVLGISVEPVSLHHHKLPSHSMARCHGKARGCGPHPFTMLTVG